MSAAERPPVFNGHGFVIGRITQLGEFEPTQKPEPVQVDLNSCLVMPIEKKQEADRVGSVEWCQAQAQKQYRKAGLSCGKACSLPATGCPCYPFGHETGPDWPGELVPGRSLPGWVRRLQEEAAREQEHRVKQDPVEKKTPRLVPDGYEGKHPRWKIAGEPFEVRCSCVCDEGKNCSSCPLKRKPQFEWVDHTLPYVSPGFDPRGGEPIPQHEPGAKLDQTKPDMSLLEDFGLALEEVALVGTYGKTKYSRGGWQFVPDGVMRYLAAGLRHWFKARWEKFDEDDYYDTPEGLPFKGRVRHRAQAAWNALAALELELRKERDL